jgi:V-type H+-transporting ATPase subunit a
MLDPVTSYHKTPYPLGLDPIWQLAENKIQFLNAYKMKVSIIIGVIHMLFGLSMSYWNYQFFQKKIDVITQFVPQVIFMVFLFFYLVLLVFHKWVAYNADGGVEAGPHCAPSVLILFINMVLFKTTEKVGDCEPYMYGGQEGFQKFLFVIAIMCVPWLLFSKPYLIHKQRLLATQKMNNVMTEGMIEGEHTQIQMNEAAGHEDDHEEFSEIMIHQGIHTIEYILGCVSNTASYLRLWALSLAHAQLSEVLWAMVMRIGLAQTAWYGGIVLYVIFAAWATLTIFILVLMEGLSAFLHTLRLHWVEFQNKFYLGTGYAFTPFSFEAILDAAGGPEE